MEYNFISDDVLGLIVIIIFLILSGVSISCLLTATLKQALKPIQEDRGPWQGLDPKNFACDQCIDDYLGSTIEKSNWRWCPFCGRSLNTSLPGDITDSPGNVVGNMSSKHEFNNTIYTSEKTE